MNCPNCNEVLVMTERQGIEIDYCPKCRGVWLDKGELDKIIDRSAPQSTTENPLAKGETGTFRKYDDDQDANKYTGDRRYGDKQYDPNYKKRKKGFLGDLLILTNLKNNKRRLPP